MGLGVLVGQGYVGLPVANRAAEAGLNVVRIGVDERNVRSLNDADSFVDISDEQIKYDIDSGYYRAIRTAVMRVALTARSSLCRRR